MVETTSPEIPLITEDGSNDTPSDVHYLGYPFNGSMLALNLALCALAIPLNLTVMTFYRTRMKGSIVSFIYFTLSTSDLLTGISTALHALIFFGLLVIGPTATSPTVIYMGVVAYFITLVSFRVSAFVSLVFAVIRTINIVSPFRRVNHQAVTIAIIVHALVWVAVLFTESILTWNLDSESLEGFFIGYFYSPSNAKFMQYIEYMDGDVLVLLKCVLSQLFTGITITIPSFLALVCMVIQIVHLLRPGLVSSNNDASDQKKNIAVTIILITLLFVVCSTLALFQPVFRDCSNTILEWGAKDQYMSTYSFGYLPFFLNAALNPLILVVRVEMLRVHVRSFHVRGTVSTTVIAIQSSPKSNSKAEMAM